MNPAEWVIDLPWSKPPMSMNDRDHWRAHRQKVAMVRNTVHALTLQAKVPALERCRVQLMYAPRDKRRRDSDNLAHVLKAACDGVTAAGVVRDDTPDLMEKPEPQIAEPGSPGRMWLVITDLSDFDLQEHYAVGGALPVATSWACNGTGEDEQVGGAS